MDATTILAKSKPGYVFQNTKEGQIFNVGVNDAGMTGIKAIGTHELITVPKGKALVGGSIIMLDTPTSAGSTATIKIQIDGEDLTPATVVTSLAKGEVISFDLDAGVGAYAEAADVTIDVVVAVQVLTAGRFILQLDLVDVLGATTRG